jgi:hypothetical protein
LGDDTDQSCGDDTVSIWVIVDVAAAATVVALLSPDVTVAPLEFSTVAVTVTEALPEPWFCTSVATDTMPEPVDPDGVETNTPS